MRRTDSLLARMHALAERHGPTGDSSFRGIVHNLGFILSLLAPDHTDYVRTEASLEMYVQLLESGHPAFVEAEMRHPRGYFPDAFLLGHPEPHHAYIEAAYNRLKGAELR